MPRRTRNSSRRPHSLATLSALALVTSLTSLGVVASAGSAGAHTASDRLALGDRAGVVPAETRLSAFAADTADPATWIVDGPTEGSTVGSQVTFWFASSESTTNYACTLDGDTQPCYPPTTYTGLSTGQHTFSVAAQGATPSDTRTLYVDASLPIVTITSPFQNQVVGRPVTIGFESDNPNATYHCRMDLRNAYPCSSPITYNGLADGTHTFSVAADGSPATGATRQFVVDAEAPLVRLSPFGPGVTSASESLIHWSAKDRRGIEVEQLRVRQAHRGTRMPGWTVRTWSDHETWKHKASLYIHYNSRLCVQVRAQDYVGNMSQWTTPQCVVRLARHP